MIILFVKIGYEDYRKKIISNKLVLMIFICGTLSVWLFPEISLFSRISGVFAVSVPLLFLACIVPGSIGGGDVKLMAAAGWGIGIAGILDAFVIGILAAGVCILILLLSKKIDRKTEISLGTFLCMGIIRMLLKL